MFAFLEKRDGRRAQFSPRPARRQAPHSEGLAVDTSVSRRYSTRMDETACPACTAAHDEDAKYCDQCGQPLVDPDKDEGDGDCPACGGIVDDQGDGKGVCRRCGLELRET